MTDDWPVKPPKSTPLGDVGHAVIIAVAIVLAIPILALIVARDIVRKLR
jgi:hypothetical protein